MIICLLIVVLEFIYLTVLFEKYNQRPYRTGLAIFLLASFTFGYFKIINFVGFSLTTILLMSITALFLGLLYLLFIGLFDYQKGTFLFTLINAVVLIGDQIKIKQTGKTVVAADFKGGMFWEVVWAMFLKNYLVYCLIALALLVVAFYFLQKRHQKIYSSTQRLRQLVFSVVGSGVLVVSLLTLVPLQDTNVTEKGAILSFVDSFQTKIIKRPANYSEATINELVKKYQKMFPKTKQCNQNSEIVVEILSEAFADPTTFSGTNWQEDPMPTIRRLQQTNGGYLYSPVFGGGTANVEYGVITGFNYSFFDPATNAYDYLKDNPERAYSLTKVNQQVGITNQALHTHLKTGYNRDKILPILGFSTFVTREEMIAEKDQIPLYYQEGYISDDTFFNRLIDEINQTKVTKGLFLHALSMQNHYPYTEEFKGELTEEQNLLAGKLADLSKDERQLALYARGIKETDQALANFLQLLDQEAANITVVFYGDHYPSLNSSVFQKYPIKTTTNARINDHTTPYFIWKNHNRQHTEKEQPIQTPEGLSTRILQEEQVELPTFYQMVRYINSKVPAEVLNGEPAKTKEQTELLADYQLIQYDLLVGKQYSQTLMDP